MESRKSRLNMDNLVAEAKQWAIERELHVESPTNQIAKIGEEFGELCSAIQRQNGPATVDAIGDMLIALNTLSLQLGFDIKDCIVIALDEVRYRKGQKINGSYIKENDSKYQ